MNHDLEELYGIVAEWVVHAPNDAERARYRLFASELRKVQRRIFARPSPPSEEDIEVALTALLALSGRRLRWPTS
jgi:hypothetical protein